MKQIITKFMGDKKDRYIFPKDIRETCCACSDSVFSSLPPIEAPAVMF